MEFKNITDNYQFTMNSDGEFSLLLENGTGIHANLISDEAGTYYIFAATKADGTVILSQDGNLKNEEEAKLIVKHFARKVINQEVPLTGDVDWSNNELVSLLVEQERAALCPNCMGLGADKCQTCKGDGWVLLPPK